MQTRAEKDSVIKFKTDVVERNVSHATVMKDHIDGHSIADLVSVVSTEVPISTESALSMEANTVV